MRSIASFGWVRTWNHWSTFGSSMDRTTIKTMNNLILRFSRPNQLLLTLINVHLWVQIYAVKASFLYNIDPKNSVCFFLAAANSSDIDSNFWIPAGLEFSLKLHPLKILWQIFQKFLPRWKSFSFFHRRRLFQRLQVYSTGMDWTSLVPLDLVHFFST